MITDYQRLVVEVAAQVAGGQIAASGYGQVHGHSVGMPDAYACLFLARSIVDQTLSSIPPEAPAFLPPDIATIRKRLTDGGYYGAGERDKLLDELIAAVRREVQP